MTFAATMTRSLGSKHTKNVLVSRPNTSVVYLEPCLVVANVIFSHWGGGGEATSTPPNSVAAFKGPL